MSPKVMVFITLNYLSGLWCVYLLIVQLAIVYLLSQVLYVFNTDVYSSRVCINVH